MSVSEEVIRSLRIKFLIEVEQNPDKYHQKDVERVKTNDWWIERFVLVNNTEDLALQNFIKTMEWRKSLGVNDLTDHSFPQKFYKIGLVSICPIKDKEGRSVLWAKANRMGKSGFTPMFQSFIVYLLEKMDSQVTNQGWALVVDTTGFGLSNVDVDLSKFLIDVYQNHYPRSLKYIAVIDLPWILNAISKVIMTFMDEELRNIVNFISKQELIQYIDSQHIPVQLNGLQG